MSDRNGTPALLSSASVDSRPPMMKGVPSAMRTKVSTSRLSTMGANSISSETPASSLAADSVEMELMIVSICSVTSVPMELMRGRRLRTMPMGKYSMPLETVDVVAVDLTMGI